MNYTWFSEGPVLPSFCGVVMKNKTTYGLLREHSAKAILSIVADQNSGSVGVLGISDAGVMEVVSH